MMNNRYKEKMSQYSVPEELIRATAGKMDAILEKKEKKAHPFQLRPRMVAAMAAALLFVISSAVYFTHSGLLDMTSPENAGDSMVSQGNGNESPSGDLVQNGENAQTENDAAGSNEKEPVGSETTGVVGETQTKSRGTPVKLSTDFYGIGGVNYERRLGYTVDEVVSSGNPWINSGVTSLPVFHNSISEYGYLNLSDGLSMESMKSIAYRIAGELNAKVVSSAEGVDVDPSNGVAYRTDYTLDCEDGIRIWVQMDGSASITYLNAKDVLSNEKYLISEYEATLTNLYSAYHGILQMANPKPFFYVDYDSSGMLSCKSFFYDKAGTVVDEILSYNLFPVSVDLVESEGYLVKKLSFRVAYFGNSLGSIPIILQEEAQDKLLNGNYITTIPYDSPVNLDTIKAVELVYWTHESLEYHQPMYRFWVELEQQSGEVLPAGMHTYGAFYVPAVADGYIDNSVLEQPY